MAIDEDVDVVAMSLLNGAHMTAFPKVAKLIREKGGDDILLVGGGIIPDEDKPLLAKQGISQCRQVIRLIAIALACGFLPGPCALLLWALYLSFCNVASPFFDFQWDSLLLETALVAVETYVFFEVVPKLVFTVGAD